MTTSPSAYRVEHVTFPSDGVTLVGKLFVPEGTSNPWPALPILGPFCFTIGN